MDGFPSGQRGQTVNLLQIASVVRIHLHPFAEKRFANLNEAKLNLVERTYRCGMPMWLNWQSSWFVISRLSVRVRSSALKFLYIIAGWSSLEARRAHNPKVIGSNPIPAIFYVMKRAGDTDNSDDWAKFTWTKAYDWTWKDIRKRSFWVWSLWRRWNFQM